MNKLYQKFIKPKSTNEDVERKEFILNIILLSNIFLSAIANLIKLAYSIILNLESQGLPIFICFLILLFFSFLYYLSRQGKISTASHALITLYFIITTYMIYAWGVELPQALLFYTLIITIAGILVNTRFAFLITLATSLTTAIIFYLQNRHIIIFNNQWKYGEITIGDIVVIIVTFVVLAIISWLSNREIEKSLRRARRSEADLKKERDSLEIKVEERTRELKKTQMEKMTQLYRFAEFGRLSSGLFHDLINPLTAISLNLEQIKNVDKAEINQTKAHLARALSCTRRMEDFIVAVRKQIKKQNTLSYFSINEEIRSVIQIFSYKARQAEVKLVFNNPHEITVYNDSIKFSQVLSNLVSNAIDAYTPHLSAEEILMSEEKNNVKISKDRLVKIELTQKKDLITISVSDNGEGINQENLEKIFEPFFTTKGIYGGTGIGLSTARNIIEIDFGGTIKAESKPHQGTKFIIEFPEKNSQAIMP